MTKKELFNTIKDTIINILDSSPASPQVTGNDLQGRFFCKVLSADMNMQGFQYKMGINEDIKPLTAKGTAGLYFAEGKDIGNYFNYGTKLAIVSVPNEEPVYVENGALRSHKLIITNVMDLSTVEAWKCLVENGADITAAMENYAVCMAAINGNLNIIQYLNENGADIAHLPEQVISNVAEAGHLDIIEYLRNSGADIPDFKNDLDSLINYYEEVAKRDYFEDYLLDASER